MSAEVDWTRNNAVNILTIHSSKGLEFPFVFVVNLVSQRFPSRDRKEQIPVPSDIIRETLPQGNENLQEERRLFYVAMTRAKDKLYLTASRFYGDGKRARKISPFVIEALGEAAIDAIVKKQTVADTGQQLSLLEVLNDNLAQEKAPIIPEKVVTHTPTYISYSQLQTFHVCPLHYKLRYILNVPSPASPALSYGVSVHSSLRDFFQLMQEKEPLTANRIHALLEQNWIKVGYESKKHEQQAYDQADTMLLSFAKQTLAEPPQTIGIELPFNFSLDKLKIGGRIDRIDQLPDGKIEIIDYKTGPNVPTEKKVKEDFQLSFYALAATQMRDGILNKQPEEIILTLYYLEANKKLSTTRSAADLEIAKEKILALVDEISHSDFRCSGGRLCKDCEYKMVCQTFS
jgi:DNA helicase-2/ATP-dependent DNA helicase PcrA